MTPANSWEIEAENQLKEVDSASEIMKQTEAKDRIHKYGFKLFDYQINTEMIQNKFMNTRFWLELCQMEMHVGPGSPLVQIGYSSELLGVIFTFSMERFWEDKSSLMFIDVNVK